MQTYELVVEGRSIRANCDDTTLVRTSVGVDRIHILFDNDEWLAFPLTVTFAQSGVNPVTEAITVSSVSGSSEWHAESTVAIPYEVITMVGPIRVTLQGTDSDGNHIITAKGSPLSVEEAGDVAMGTVPGDAPTIDQWTQAYSNAQTAINDVQTLINTLQSQLDAMVLEARTSLDEVVAAGVPIATNASLGVVKVGSGLSVSEDGVISANETNGITASQASQIANLAALAYYCFDTTFDSTTGIVSSEAKVKSSALPIDGLTLKVNDDGKVYVAVINADSEVY